MGVFSSHYGQPHQPCRVVEIHLGQTPKNGPVFAKKFERAEWAGRVGVVGWNSTRPHACHGPHFVQVRGAPRDKGTTLSVPVGNDGHFGTAPATIRIHVR